jgi:hypothetical protein
MFSSFFLTSNETVEKLCSRMLSHQNPHMNNRGRTTVSILPERPHWVDFDSPMTNKPAMRAIVGRIVANIRRTSFQLGFPDPGFPFGAP